MKQTIRHFTRNCAFMKFKGLFIKLFKLNKSLIKMISQAYTYTWLLMLNVSYPCPCSISLTKYGTSSNNSESYLRRWHKVKFNLSPIPILCDHTVKHRPEAFAWNFTWNLWIVICIIALKFKIKSWLGWQTSNWSFIFWRCNNNCLMIIHENTPSF